MTSAYLVPRQSATPDPDYTGDTGINGDDSTSQFLRLIADPFQSELNSTSFFASLGFTFAGSAALVLLFCFLRPRTNAVYAPRAKHADSKHAPPPIDNGLFSWIKPIKSVREHELVEKIGLDAVVFLRFIRMLRNIFAAVSIVGIAVLIPVNLTGQHATPQGDYGKTSYFMKFTPQFSSGSKFWAFTICAYVINAIVCFFLWWNYRAVLKLRRTYFNSPDYLQSLHSRTLLISRIPKEARTDEGISQLAEAARATEDVPRAAIARNVRDLPELIEEHEHNVKELEKILAKYLKDPNKLPVNRPTCKPSKKDRARNSTREVDAIDYYTERIRELELEIKQVRESVDQRNPMPFGFASYTHIEDAHSVAYAARSKGPRGTRFRLAPRPNDLIWKNLGLSPQARNAKRFWNGLWITVLTLLFIVPNILTAVFLSDLANLGLVWHGFQRSLEAHRTWWGIVQGIVAPAFNGLFYLILPTIFRRMFSNAGDTTKTSRERHVASRLFAFFVFNRLFVFSIFAALWRFIAAINSASKTTQGITWNVIKNQHVFRNIVIGLINASPFWITNQMQNNLGVAVDIIQLLPLLWGSFQRRFLSPTPRQVIELSAPQPVEYAAYYNAYLFTAAVGFCFATIQPLILPFTAFFFAIEGWTKKYLVLYVLITKTESGGVFWRMLFNRVLFSILLGDVVIALVVGALGVTNVGIATVSAAMLWALVPLPFLIAGFKYYCARMYDSKISYYTTHPLSELESRPADLSNTTPGESKRAARRADRVGVRFGNPALYKKLITPMVSARSQHLLRDIYSGRLAADEMAGMRPGSGVFGYSDVYMSEMSKTTTGKPAPNATVDGAGANVAPGFEIVQESEMDFEHFKRRSDFREEFGGEGQLYGRDADAHSRHSSIATLSTMGGFMNHKRQTSSPTDSRASSRTRYDPNTYGPAAAGDGEEGTSYPSGYQRADSPARGRRESEDITFQGHPAFRSGSREDLISSAAGIARDESPRRHYASYGNSGRASPSAGRAYQPYRYESPQGMGSRPGSALGGNVYTPAGYTPEDSGEDTSYDYFRRGRRG